jgi:3-methylfumaryl-CoA hydratase
MNSDFLHLLGRSTLRTDSVDLHRWRTYYKFFNLSPERERPLAFHWLLFNELSSELRPDGHPIIMEPFPDLPFPRRMWVGGEITWSGALAPGVSLKRTTTICRAQLKAGAAGQFLLTSLEHVVDGDTGRLLQERQDVAFLPQEGSPRTTVPRTSPFKPQWVEHCHAGTVDLFRYSALTLNSHRIHYDEPYAKDVERHPALVVHAPLLATQLMHAAARRHAGAVPVRFSYRAVAPLYLGDTYRLGGRPHQEDEELVILGPDGGARMTATMSFGSADSARSRSISDRL